MTSTPLVYLDSSAIVKLAVAEHGSGALRRYVGGRRRFVSSALAYTEVLRALLPIGTSAVDRGRAVCERVDLIRISNRILHDAATLQPANVRSLDAIHLATAQLLGEELSRLVTYDDRMQAAAQALDLRTERPA